MEGLKVGRVEYRKRERLQRREGEKSKIGENREMRKIERTESI